MSNDSPQVSNYPKQEVISCPGCHTDQRAEIVFHIDEPWPRYIHTCTNCGYIIMESEWEVVK